MTLDYIINSGDPREIKRALAVKMFEHGSNRNYISMILTVSESYVSKWNNIYRKSGEEGLLPGYIGSQGYLDEFDRYDVIQHIKTKDTITVDELSAYVTENFGVTYSSKQSYYDLLHEARMSWKKTEKINPKRDEAAVLEKRKEIKKNFRIMRKILSQVASLYCSRMSVTCCGKMLWVTCGEREENLPKYR